MPETSSPLPAIVRKNPVLPDQRDGNVAVSSCLRDATRGDCELVPGRCAAFLESCNRRAIPTVAHERMRYSRREPLMQSAISAFRSAKVMQRKRRQSGKLTSAFGFPSRVVPSAFGAVSLSHHSMTNNPGA